MPAYSMSCEECEHEFEINCFISDYDGVMKGLSCPSCDSKSVVRNYGRDLVTSTVAAQTLGSLAEKNASKMSDEAMARLNYKNHEYLFKDLDKPLPEGMKRIRKAPIDDKYYPPTPTLKLNNRRRLNERQRQRQRRK
jgi:hypothetical protein